jgi:hypothetical protein
LWTFFYSFSNSKLLFVSPSLMSSYHLCIWFLRLWIFNCAIFSTLFLTSYFELCWSFHLLWFHLFFMCLLLVGMLSY